VSVSSNATNVSVGDSVTVNVTVNNQGDVASQQSVMSLRNGSSDVDSVAVPALAPGEDTNLSLRGTVDASGSLAILADSDETITEFNEQNNRHTVRFVEPDVTVTELEASRENGTITFAARVSNPSAVRSQAMEIRLENGPNVSTSQHISALEPETDTVVNFSISEDRLTSAFATRVTADSNESVTESDETNNARTANVLRPTVELQPGEVNYYQQDGTTTAVVLVPNTGLQSATGSVTVSNFNGSEQFGQTTVTLNASSNTKTAAYTSTELPLKDVSENETVLVTVEINNTTEDIAVDTVAHNTTLTPPTGTIELNQSTVERNRSVKLFAETHDIDGTIESLEWRVNGAVIATNQSNLTWTPNERGNQTVTLVIRDDDGVEKTVNRTVYVHVPRLSSALSVPTDPDGDGEFEDINGDGEVNIVDVQAMFVNRDKVVTTNSSRAFDFSGNGVVNIIDVQHLFNEVI
ncbi:CARDB domain-containing protein, partial [Haloferax profundi]